MPGPRQPLHALGRPLIQIIPYVPIASTLRTGVAILTYLDAITFGITWHRVRACPARTPRSGSSPREDPDAGALPARHA
ncbi:MAG: WS/DGAT domain-containing protein [Umezawaea sp.]